MLIKQIKVDKLHGSYNYTIDFFSDLTFLYGSNGCGKTTILNILTAIVTGKLYDLVYYFFEKIQLSYEEDENEIHDIEITTNRENNLRNMTIKWEKKILRFDDVDNLRERIYRKVEDGGFEEAFFSAYPMAKEVKQMFNYIYLPLSRYGSEMYSDRDYYHFRSHFMLPLTDSYKTYLNTSLKYIAELIKNGCLKINVQENRINDTFRKDVVSESISVSSNIQIGKIIHEIQDCDWEDVLRSKDAYVATLKEIDMYDAKLKPELENFFKEFKKAYDEYQNKKNDKTLGIRIDFAWQYAEFLKIERIVDLAKENEKIKNKVRRPKEIFLSVINDFFASSGAEKRVCISSDGQLEFREKNRAIRLLDLSSGEKQIIITFASLIFGFTDRGTGIFIIDEPESSLHLEWQQRFVSSILKLDKKIQLIFATHSPEIIGRYREKAVELKKNKEEYSENDY